MAHIPNKGKNPMNTNGDLPAVGSSAPDFVLVAAYLSEKTLASFAGKKKILTINPSYDTGTFRSRRHASARPKASTASFQCRRSEAAS